MRMFIITNKETNKQKLTGVGEKVEKLEPSFLVGIHNGLGALKKSSVASPQI